MDKFIESAVNEIKSMTTQEEVNDYFSKHSLFTVTQIGEILEALIFTTNHEPLKKVLKTEFFKNHSSAETGYDEPVAQTIAYAICGFASNKDLDINRRTFIKRTLMDILLDDSYHIDWTIVDGWNCSLLHVIAEYSDYFTLDEIKELLFKGINKQLPLLNRNSENNDIIDLFMASESLSIEDKHYLTSIIASTCDSECVVVPDDVYQEAKQ